MALPRSSWRIVAVIAAVAVTTLAMADPPAQQQQVTVEITLSGTDVTVSDASITVRRGQPIRWTSNAPFSIVVERHGSIFPTPPPQAMRGLANRPLQVNVGGSAAAGTYKYTVVVWDAANGEMRVLDPEIVVQVPDED